MYTEATAFNENDIARLVSPPLESTTEDSIRCLSFYYHMRGRKVRLLNIYLLYESHRKLVNVIRYNQGNM